MFQTINQLLILSYKFNNVQYIMNSDIKKHHIHCELKRFI
jgi:hypothetical protein